MQRKLVAFTLIICFLVSYQVQSQTATLNQQDFLSRLDNYTQQLLSKIPVIPALTITIVNENGAIFNKAYGWADKEAGVRADPNTAFYIASSTKSFTGLAAALLDQEKKILLDEPIKKYFTNIQFNNGIGNDVTVRSLLNHTSGLENSPLTFRMAYSGAIEEKDMIRILKEATTVRAKPGVYKYDNLGYNIYALALQEYLHTKWQDVLQDKIFTPLGMKRTTAYISMAKKNKWPMAVPYYGYGEKGLTRLYLQKNDNTMQSAGGLITTPTDLAIWLQAQMNAGKIKGRQIFPEQVMKAVHIGTASYEKGSSPFTAGGNYALGWSVSEYNKEKIIYHFGGFPGFKSHISFMPGKKIGVAILVNEGSIGSGAVDVLASYVYDWVTGNADIEQVFNKRMEDLAEGHKRAMDGTQRAYADRAKRTSQLSWPLQTYTGKFSNPLYGDVDVLIENNALAVKMGNLHAVSTPFTQKETIRVELIPPTGQVVYFKMDESGKVHSLVYDNQEYKRVF